MAQPDPVAIDFEAIDKQLSELIHEVLPFRVATKDQLNDERLSQLTYGLFKSEFNFKLNSGHLFYCTNEEKLSLAKRIAFEFEAKCELTEPHFTYARREPLVRRVRRLLSERSAEVVAAWGELQFVYGLYIALHAFSGGDDADLKSAKAGRLQSTKIQRHWYAHWIKRNSPALLSRHRKQAEENLEQLLLEIKQEKLLPWGPYPKDWYVQMLERHGRDLKTTYRDLTKPELEELISDGRITQALLPPLSAGGFNKVGR